MEWTEKSEEEEEDRLISQLAAWIHRQKKEKDGKNSSFAAFEMYSIRVYVVPHIANFQTDIVISIAVFEQIVIMYIGHRLTHLLIEPVYSGHFTI